MTNRRAQGGPDLGDWAWVANTHRTDLAAICAIGDPDTRKRVVEKAQALGLLFTNAISPDAHVAPDAEIGKGVMVFPHAVIGRQVLLADHSGVNAGSTLGHETNIERYGTISPGVRLAGNVLIGEGSFLRIGSCVIQRRSIGAWATIGAGAAVVDDIPANVIAVGVPARVIRTKQRK